jgi:hypothetical protein
VRRPLPLHGYHRSKALHSRSTRVLWPRLDASTSPPSLPCAATASHRWPLPCACHWSTQVRYKHLQVDTTLTHYRPASTFSPHEQKPQFSSGTIAAELTPPPTALCHTIPPADEQHENVQPPPCSPATHSPLRLHKLAAFWPFPNLMNIVATDSPFNPSSFGERLGLNFFS